MKSREYWEKRAIVRKLQAEQQAILGAQEIQRQYDIASAAIQKDLSYWISKFAENNKLSLLDAKKLLKSDELKEFRWTVEEYIAHGESNLAKRWEKELINASARVHISRLQAIQTQLRMHIEQLTGREQKEIQNLLSNIYKNQYYSRAFDIQKGIGIGWNLQKIDTRRIDRVLKMPWAIDGSLYSERVWKDKEQLICELNTQLTQAMITGKSLSEMVKVMAARVGVHKRRAATLIYTETSAISSLAEKDCYANLGIGEYEILATLDSRTSEICREMDGKHFLVSDMRPGITAPPFHPNCRTDTCPYFADWEEMGGSVMRAARDRKNKGYELVPAGMSYKEWERKFVGESSVENPSESGIIKITKIVSGHTGTPKIAKPNAIIDHKMESGSVDVRSFYDSKGWKIKDIHTTDHGNPKRHPYGNHGEHVHDYVWNDDGTLKEKMDRALTDEEKERNSDIV